MKARYDISNICFLDLETRSTVDLLETGVYVYAESPITDIYVACYVIGEGELKKWYPGDQVPADIISHLERGGLISAHNFTGFEWVMWTEILTPRYGWPAITLEQGHCTAAEAAYLALPRSLDGVGAALGLPVTKDKEGNALMKRMCRPRKTTVLPPEDDPGVILDSREFTYDEEAHAVHQWWCDEDRMARLTSYCGQDVLVARECYKRLKRLPEVERQVWLADARINARGVYLDIPAIKNAQYLVDRALEAANATVAEITGGYAATINQRDKIMTWLELMHGIECTSLDKNAVTELLSRDLPEDVRRLLIVRQNAGAASVKKLKAMLNCASKDQRARGCFLYSGAGTHRWTGMRIQMQNILRNTEENIDFAIEVMAERDLGYFELFFGPAIPAISRCLRGMIKAPPGKILYIADYSNIEGRVNAFLSGEEKKLDAFRLYDKIIRGKDGKPLLDKKGEPLREGPDLYKVAAAGIYSIPIDKVTKDQRQVGKVTELACIAEGELVLTNRGEVPIEQVKPGDLLWDGVEWVTHEGLLAKGKKVVMFHDGLWATKDHVVFLSQSDNSVAMNIARALGMPLSRATPYAPPVSTRARRAQTYDILNAGPRHRFTVSGVLVHNCGYQGGVGAFAKMAIGYGVNLEAMIWPLWESASEVRKLAAVAAWKKYRKQDAEALSRRAFIASDLAKSGWREDNPNIAASWKTMQKAAMSAVQYPGTVFEAGPIKYVATQGFLWCALPSGRRLAYAAPRIVQEPSPWEEIEFDETEVNGERVFTEKPRRKINVLTYLGVDAVTRQFKRCKLYGGLAVENNTQSFARDLLADSILRAEAAGFPIVLHAHDELVAEVPIGFKSVEEFGDLMCELPGYAAGLPIAWAGEESFRYKK